MIVNVEESRCKCNILLVDADNAYNKKNFDEAEKLYLRICRLAENIFCKTSKESFFRIFSNSFLFISSPPLVCDVNSVSNSFQVFSKNYLHKVY